MDEEGISLRSHVVTNRKFITWVNSVNRNGGNSGIALNPNYTLVSGKK